MEKTEARKRLDTCIDECLDCDGIVTPEKNCYICPVLPRIREAVIEIREQRKK